MGSVKMLLVLLQSATAVYVETKKPWPSVRRTLLLRALQQCRGLPAVSRSILTLPRGKLLRSCYSSETPPILLVEEGVAFVTRRYSWITSGLSLAQSGSLILSG